MDNKHHNLLSYGIFVNTLKWLRIAHMVFIVLPFVAVSAGNPWQGLTGEQIFLSVRKNCKPKAYVEQVDLWKVFRTTDCYAGNMVLNRFSSDTYTFDDRDVSPMGLSTMNVLNRSWWSDGYAQNIERDLHNLLPAPIGVQALKKDYPLGNVDVADYQNDYWSVGQMSFADDFINVYSPPKGFEGDFARTVFYLLAVYETDRFHGLGKNFCLKGSYPILQPWAERILLAWNLSDPVDEYERSRNDAVETVQGNRNPFIDDAMLAEHVWGEKRNEPYVPEEDVKQKVPLRAFYSLSDESIDLYSPYISEDVTWTIDGKEAAKSCYKPYELGIGRHEIKYFNSVLKGMLIIEILP